MRLRGDKKPLKSETIECQNRHNLNGSVVIFIYAPK